MKLILQNIFINLIKLRTIDEISKDLKNLDDEIEEISKREVKYELNIKKGSIKLDRKSPIGLENQTFMGKISNKNIQNKKGLELTFISA